MNREELEKEIKQIADYLWCNDDELVSEIMKLIPEVLKSVIPDEEPFWYYAISKKAKEQFNINL
jgi:hypothetical protein